MNQNLKLFLRKHPHLYDFVAYLYSLRKDDRKFRKLLKAEIRHLKKTMPELRIIQVGANDSGHGDPFRRYLKSDRGISAVLLEPVDYVFERLDRKYRDFKNVRCLNAAVVAEKSPDLRFYSVNKRAKDELGDSIPVWWDQLGSFDRHNIEKHLDGVLIPYIQETAVEQYTLDEVYGMFDGNEPDILHTDCEGYDYELISHFDLERFHPHMILFEHKHMSEDNFERIQKKLASYGYKLSTFRDDCVAIA